MAQHSCLLYTKLLTQHRERFTRKVYEVCHPEAGEQHIGNGSRHEVTISMADDAAMPAYLAVPESGSGPGILVISDMYGRSPYYESLAERLANLGYVALCPDPFHRIGPLDDRTYDQAIARRRSTNEVEMLGDLEVSLDWLRDRPEVTSGKLATMGFCMGGTFTLNLAATRSDLVTACFYGFPAGSKGPQVTAPVPLDIVDDMSGPMIGFWGENDTSVGLDNVQRLIAALTMTDRIFHSVTYPNVGHGFMADDSQDDRTRDARQHAWARVTAFLLRHLAGT